MWYTWYKKSPRRSGYDRYENFVARNTLSANAGACLSLKGELAQEHERIRHLQRIEKNKTYKVYRQYPGQHEIGYIYTRVPAVARTT